MWLGETSISFRNGTDDECEKDIGLFAKGSCDNGDVWIKEEPFSNQNS